MSVPQAPQKCHNCRRRRLRCDRTQPACRKCTTSGQQCLGYGQLFIWTDSVATRGRWAGQASFAPKTPAPQSLVRKPSPTLESSSSTSSSTTPASSPSCLELSSRPRSLVPTPCWNGGDFLSPNSGAWGSARHGITFRSLVDPVMQDFDPTTRYYLHYYTERVTQDLVVYDTPHRNPFRNLVPLCQRHAFLKHVVVALSAVHQVSYLRSRGLPLQTRLLDALEAKQKTLRLVKDALEHLGPHNYSDVLIAVVFLINFELIDSGRDSWKAHVGAAGRLIRMLQSPAAAVVTAEQTSTLPAASMAVNSSISELGDYIMSDCLSYFILGSTLGSWEGTSAAEAFGSLDVVSMLLRAESNTYHSCPSEILFVILRSSQLAAEMHSGGVSSVNIETASSLMRQLLSFDAHGWAEGIIAASGDGHGQSESAKADILRSREHMASAHRSAACAYLLMATPEAFAFVGGGPRQYQSPTTDQFASAIFQHLSCVPETDMLFKGSVWPTFILGAQSADPGKRAWVMKRLGLMWLSMCPWGYVKTAMETLEALWQFRDGEAILPSSSCSSLSPYSQPLPSTPQMVMRREWLSELKALNVDCLIV